MYTLHSEYAKGMSLDYYDREDKKWKTLKAQKLNKTQVRRLAGRLCRILKLKTKIRFADYIDPYYLYDEDMIDFGKDAKQWDALLVVHEIAHAAEYYKTGKVPYKHHNRTHAKIVDVLCGFLLHCDRSDVKSGLGSVRREKVKRRGSHSTGRDVFPKAA